MAIIEENGAIAQKLREVAFLLEELGANRFATTSRACGRRRSLMTISPSTFTSPVDGKTRPRSPERARVFPKGQNPPPVTPFTLGPLSEFPEREQPLQVTGSSNAELVKRSRMPPVSQTGLGRLPRWQPRWRSGSVSLRRSIPVSA